MNLPQQTDPGKPDHITRVDPAHEKPEPLGRVLGEPFDSYAAARERWIAAVRAEWAATVAGDVNARERAITDQLEAMAEWQKIRDHRTAKFLFDFRITTEDDHGGLFRARLRELARDEQREEEFRELREMVIDLKQQLTELVETLAARLGRKAAA